MGWQWARELSVRGLAVSVLTRASHRPAIERRVLETGECAAVHFEYVDLPRLHCLTARINRRNHLYYYFWQWVAYRRAWALHQAEPFDLVHHVTWVSFRQPSFMGLLGAPFVFGPVAGGDEIPFGYLQGFGWRARAKEWVRHVANALVRFDPLMGLTYATAQRVYFTSEGHLARVSARVRRKAYVELAIGSDAQVQPSSTPSRPRAARLLFVGRCIGWKGMDLGLEVLARVRRQRPEVSLTIIGDGEDRARWQARAELLGLADAVHWLGWLPKDEVQRRYADFDLLFYPSLRDSGGFVVLEALQVGLPVVCWKLGGPGVVVDDSCGAAVLAQPVLDQALDDYAGAVLQTLEKHATGQGLGEACRARARQFTWPALIGRIHGLERERVEPA
ncbi:glycosyltransferase [Candidatus Dactylopiibacterium carminicum]|uniref:glycosyltransferase n=1 Tax=Candidatus Dactylopiibacterium carminicum TaxID=857335 RepID=UPI000BA9D7E8|nr:glycosyltransferase [Candidatus Dactylopiibacterium carminicum]